MKKIVLSVIAIIAILGVSGIPIISGNDLNSSLIDIDNKDTKHFESFVSIEYPSEFGYVYLFGEEWLYILGLSIVIGPITVEIAASEDITEVSFKLDGIEQIIDNERPFEFRWYKLSFGKTHSITVTGETTEGQYLEDSISIMKIL
jgi:hypothetical protein